MKKGDTLIEVAIAIAVFSLVAIGVVSVVNGSTSAAQNALEVTVTREEIDAQAEALRYIHTSYIAGSQSNSADNEQYLRLWNEIKSHAINKTDPGTELSDKTKALLNYNPTECADLYRTGDTNDLNSIFNQGAFIINTHYLGNPDWKSNTENYLSNTVVASVVDGAPNAIFTTATTFPRVLYASSLTSQNSLLDQSGNNAGMSTNYFTDEIRRAEGLYVVAVRDQNTTQVISTNGSSSVPSRSSAFYDFYIRSCWFAPGAEHPSTISTVIRLQDPELITYQEIAASTPASFDDATDPLGSGGDEGHIDIYEGIATE